MTDAVAGGAGGPGRGPGDPAPGQVTVSTPDGDVTGAVRDGVATFRGVPYAEQRRTTAQWFSLPRPVTPWSGALDCTTRVDDRRLSVTVSTPADARPGDRLPVVVFVHGGRYESGHGDGPWYRGQAFARDRCVSVSVTYRLRFEGFLPLRGEEVPEDLGPDEPPVYRGAEDVLAAFRWVRRSITAFGGDPDAVTAAGQSAGGALVSWLLTVPRSEGLIHRAVIMSQGFPRVAWTRRRAAAAAVLGGPLTAAHVAGLPMARVRRAYRWFSRLYPTDCALGLHPYRPERVRPVPLVVGTMHDEFVRMPAARLADRAWRRPAGRSPEGPVRRAVRAAVRTAVWPVVATMLGVARRDLRAWTRYCVATDPLVPVGRTIGDSAIRRWNVMLADAHAAAVAAADPDGPARTWMYEFHGGAATPDGDAVDRGTEAQHCGELPLFFDCLDDGQRAVARFCGPDAPERLRPLADRFHRLAVDVAHGRMPDWEPYRVSGEGPTLCCRRFDMTDGTETTVVDPLGAVRALLPAHHP
ncbi:carboxylesterase family protein [Corynebacterium bovis]|uniref:carboxylesterase family protein n=1 Tax=Corynebacterium bovis TaxID=36808 RepID=UPI00163AD77E|nr:carboxylesterase family protein [Corynebacterium bovis]